MENIRSNIGGYIVDISIVVCGFIIVQIVNFVKVKYICKKLRGFVFKNKRVVEK